MIGAMRMRLFVLSLVFLGFFAAPAGAGPLPADRAFQLEVSRENSGIRFDWTIEDGYYLYRGHTVAKGPDGAELKLETPPGVSKEDPLFGATEVYYRQANAVIRKVPAGPIELTYQGCQDGGICYVPQTRLIDPVTLAVSNPAKQTAPTDPIPAAADGPAATPHSEPASFNLAAEEDVVQSLLREGGALLVISSFLVFGLLIAFTPCVFPLYPILAGALAREGDRLTARRGFTLSAIYVVAFAFAFSLLGAVAGWSGQNLQMALQSPLTTGAVAVVFVVLALAMFGLFELQLPAHWTNSIAGRTGRMSISKRSVAVLGFSSAFIVGPCVTAPLAGALLYIAQTGDVVLGAAALFALGIGKGIPLIAIGTLGADVLPRAGAWMESVKHIFGVGFIATAIRIATPLLPAGLDLVLWAALLIGAGTWIFSAAQPGSGFQVLARASGIMALVYGVILIIGAASGSTDPLKPMFTLAGRSQSPAERKLQFTPVSSLPELQSQLQATVGEKPSLVYFTADWCVTCHTIERSVLTRRDVQERLQDFHLIKVDLSKLDASNAELMRQLRVAGPPTMVFFDRHGREAPGTRLVGAVTIDLLSRSATAAGALQK